MTSLGIDIGGSSIKVAATRGGKTLWTRRGESYYRPSIAQLAASLGGLAGADEFDAVGLCVPGLLDRGGRRVTLSVNLPALVGTPLDEWLSRAFRRQLPPALLLTDTHAAAFDVYTSRHLAGRLLLLALGTGVGAAVWDSAGPLHVDGDSPGHFGQLDVSLPGETVAGPDGGAGSLEGYVGAPALRKRYGEHIAPALTPDSPPLAALARAMRIAHAIYRPNHVCLAGGVGLSLRALLPELRAKVSEGLTRVARPDWDLSCGDHEFHAAIGAARLAEG